MTAAVSPRRLLDDNQQQPPYKAGVPRTSVLNTPHRLLDALIVLAVAFALMVFYLIFKIIEFCGDGGDDDKKNLRRKSLLPVKNHPPEQREPPIFSSMSGACCPVQHVLKKREGV